MSTPVHGRYHESWLSRTGPGDSRPTALQIIQDEHLQSALVGKTAVVTGCSSGIGIETVRALRAAGITVFATARKETTLKEKMAEIIVEDPKSTAKIIPIVMDQESLESVRIAAAQILKESGGNINILICNAGVMATPEGRTKDGFETQFGVCHLSHFLLFQLLKPALLASSTRSFNSRVVMVSSIGHKRNSVFLDDYGFEKQPYDAWKSYGQAKTANIWMANEIDRRYGGRGIHATALHPGGIQTGLDKHTPNVGRAVFDNPAVQAYMKSIPQGAATSIWAAVSKELEGKGRKWLSNCEEWGPEGDEGVEITGIKIGDDGYAEWAFDDAGAKRLWEDSNRMVGVEDMD